MKPIRIEYNEFIENPLQDIFDFKLDTIDLSTEHRDNLSIKTIKSSDTFIVLKNYNSELIRYLNESKYNVSKKVESIWNEYIQNIPISYKSFHRCKIHHNNVHPNCNLNQNIFIMEFGSYDKLLSFIDYKLDNDMDLTIYTTLEEKEKKNMDKKEINVNIGDIKDSSIGIGLESDVNVNVKKKSNSNCFKKIFNYLRKILTFT